MLLGSIGAGCSGKGPDDGADSGGTDGCASGDITVDAGTGTDTYQPLIDGDTVTLVHGPQGGWHVETGGLVDRSESEVSIMPQVTVPDLGDLRIAGDQEPTYIALVGYDDTKCQGTFSDVNAFIDTEAGTTGLDDQAFICSLVGKTLMVTVTVSDILSGRTGADTVSVIAQPDPVDVDVCSGG
jgi:hypothetical protein